MKNLSISKNRLAAFSSFELSVYFTCMAMYGGMNEQPFNIENICDIIFGEKYTKRNKDQVKEQLGYLSEIGIFRKINNNTYHMSFDHDFKIDEKDWFISIGSEEFEKIIGCKKRNRFQALYHFCQIVASLNYNTEVSGARAVVGTMPASYFAATEKVSPTTIASCSDLLMDLKLIHIEKLTYDINNEYPITRVYSREKDKKLINKYIKNNDLLPKNKINYQEDEDISELFI